MSNIDVNLSEKKSWRVILPGFLWHVYRQVLTCILVIIIGAGTSFVYAMPDELYEGMVSFELDSGNFFNALVLMDDAYRVKYPVSYASALNGFNIEAGVKGLLDEALKKIRYKVY